MDAALLIARLVLAAVFAVAGAAKLADLEGSRGAVAGFGAPERLAVPAGTLLPVAELAIVGLLLPTATGAWGAAFALGLLVLFVVAIALNLARGRTPDCHCFGALHSEPAGLRMLARNAALGAVAAFAAVAGWSDAGTSATAWIGRLDTAGAALLLAALSFALLTAFGGLAFVHLLRQHGRLLLRLDRIEEVLTEAGLSIEVEEEVPEIGLAPGTPAPDFAVQTLEGTTAELASLLEPGLPVLLVFTSPTCGPCRTLIPRVGRWQRIHSAVLTIAIASSGELDEIRSEAEGLSLEHVLLDDDHELYRAYEANGTPSAVLIGPGGEIASWMASGSDWVERLLTDALAAVPEPEAGIPVGDPAPNVDLASLDGDSVTLSDALRGETVLLFWNPACGFCRSMHADLIGWESTREDGSPRLVVISAGEPDDVRAEGFRSTVLYDPDWKASAAYSAGGTPMAVRIDGQGQVASKPEAGAAAVFKLLTAPTKAR